MRTELMKWVLTIGIMAVLLAGCSTDASTQKNNYVNDDVMAALSDAWGDTEYEIKNTQIVTIKDNETELFEDVDYVVQFTIYSDYFDTSPLKLDVGANDAVMVYKDGSVKVRPDPFIEHIQMTYDTDLSGIVDEVIDMGNAYN